MFPKLLSFQLWDKLMDAPESAARCVALKLSHRKDYSISPAIAPNRRKATSNF
jgi:hypothetical protein